MNFSNSEQPLVSVIMPNYNGDRFVAQAIESVQKQTLRNWELLVIDDGSTDRSLEIVSEFAKKDPRVRGLKTTFKKLAKGPGAARNRGIQAAQGRYIAFLDSDDLWLPEKLSEQIAFMEQGHPFTFAWYEIVSETGAQLSKKEPKAMAYDYSRMLEACVVGCLTAMYDSRTLGKVYIDLTPLDRFSDYTLWLKILKMTPHAHCIPKVLARYRLVANSISANKWQAAKHNWVLLRQIEHLALPRAIYYFTSYAARGLLSRLFYVFKRRDA